jgi:hypothetical protein
MSAPQRLILIRVLNPLAVSVPFQVPGSKVIKEAWVHQHDSDSEQDRQDNHWQRKKMNATSPLLTEAQALTSATFMIMIMMLTIYVPSRIGF